MLREYACVILKPSFIGRKGRNNKQRTMMRSWIRPFLSTGALVTGATLGLYAAGPALGSGPISAIPVTTKAVPLNRADPAADRVGRLRYVGGVVIESSEQRFGGLSDMRWDDRCKRLLAVSDTGAWVILEPEEEGERLTGLKAAWLAPILDESGSAPTIKSAVDAEALARMPNGDHWVFFEQTHRAERFSGISACDPQTLAAPAVERRIFAPTAGWPANGGMEAASALGDSLVVLSETVPAPDGGRLGFQQTGNGPARLFTWVPPEGHEPTGMDIIEGQGGEKTMLVLHRRFSPFTGVSAVLSEAPISDPVGARIEGQEVARLVPPFTVDNMEGIAARAEAGRQYVYLVSDNNFNSVQRTILMKFELLPPGKPAAGR